MQKVAHVAHLGDRPSACLIWFTEQSLSNALRLEQYIKDAEDDGDSDLADFSRRAQEASRKGGEKGKELLRSRLAGS